MNYPLKSMSTLFCLIALMTVSINVSACRLSVTNDSEQTVILSPLDAGQEAVTLAPGETNFFGSPHEHARFSLLMQENGTATCQRVVEQYACGAKKDDVNLTVSALLADPVAASLAKMFTFSSCNALSTVENQ